MPHHSPREHQEERAGRYRAGGSVEDTQVEVTDPEYKSFLTKEGDILFTVSDRPHVGFHSALPHQDENGNPTTQGEP
jgi:hypothetical protein